jgi:hypothetical protein
MENYERNLQAIREKMLASPLVTEIALKNYELVRQIANQKASEEHLTDSGSEPWNNPKEPGYSVIWGRMSEERDTPAEIAAVNKTLEGLGIGPCNTAPSDDGRVWVILANTADFAAIHPKVVCKAK